MSKFIAYINSDTIDENALWSLKFGTSLGTWFLIFHLMTTLIATVEHTFSITPQENSTASGIIIIFMGLCG